MRLALALTALLFAGAALPQQQTPKEERSVESLLAEIREKGDSTRPSVFEALGKRQSDESFEALVDGVDSLSKYNAYYWAFRAFRHFKDVQKLEGRALDYLQERTFEDKSAIFNAAGYGIREFGDAGFEHYERIVRRCPNNNPKQMVIGKLAPKLIERQSKGDLELFLENFRQGTSGPDQLFLDALPPFMSPRGLATIADQLEERQTALTTKKLIVRSLIPVENDRADSLLVIALKQKVVGLQLEAIEALRLRGYKKHARDLEKLTRSDDEELRCAALVARASLPVKAGSWIKRILNMARSKDAIERRAAARCLAGLDSEDALQALFDLFPDGDVTVRRAAYNTALEKRSKSAIPALFERLGLETGQDQELVNNTLVLLTGEDYGAGVGRWKAWWSARGDAAELPSLEVAEGRHKERERRKRAAARTSFYGLKIGENNVYFVLDASGSMSAKNEWDETRFEVVKQEVEGALKRYTDGKSFNVVFFGSKIAAWQEELVEMTAGSREAATKFVQDRGIMGATALYDGLKRAFDDPDMEAVYLLSDGAPGGGTINDVAEIRGLVAEWNEERKVPIHCISAGQRHPLLVNLALDSGGQFREVD